MSDVNVGLRLELDALNKKLQPAESIADIERLVKEHAQTAYTLAIMEKRPPGYTEVEWALVLMDKPREELRDRLIDRARREEDRLGPISVHRLLREPMSILPVIPSSTPPELAPKMIQLDREWLRELCQRQADAVVAPFVAGRRDEKVFRAAQVQLRAWYAQASGERGGRLPFKVSLHMTKQGTFEVRLGGR